MNTWWFFVLCFLFLAVSAEEKERPLVNTPLGKIKGYHKKSAKRNVFSAFEGIPYAKPPVGELRFEPPQPVEAWKGTWEATTVTECPQTQILKTNAAQGEEDCLHVNVYVPREKPTTDEKLPVIVHIHGGLFMYGSGHGYSHPEYFMDEEVIFVNFNYRLGVFGFLSTEDNVVPGNNGLKDQVMALKWVQKNIASFGGNPESVTLTGLSAGASSVHYHYLSDQSVGLFHRGFSQSGVALNHYALTDAPKKKAKLLANAVGCPTSYSGAMVKCLKERPMRNLLSKMGTVFGYSFFPVTPFGPVLEQGSNPFINKNPYYLLAKGKVQNLPWLVSTVSHEGLFPGIFVLKELDVVAKNWTQLAPFLLDYSDSSASVLWDLTTKTITENYFGDAEINNQNSEQLLKMFSDRFLVDVESALRLQARANKNSVYYYQFGFSSDHSTNKTVAHGEDAQYFFYAMYNRQPTPNELKMKDLLIEMLITFVKSGKPRIADRKWTPVSSSELVFLNITSFNREEIKLVTVDELAPVEFWTSLGLRENKNLVMIKDEL